MDTESDLVAPDDPANEDGGKGIKGHEGGIDGPFALDDAGVEDGESGDGLQPHEGGRGHLPGIVALVEPVWLSGHGVGVGVCAIEVGLAFPEACLESDRQERIGEVNVSDATSGTLQVYIAQDGRNLNLTSAASSIFFTRVHGRDGAFRGMQRRTVSQGGGTNERD